MNRTLVMTLGLLLVFFGIQLNIVDSYVLTPRMANFLSDQFPDTPAIEAGAANANQQGGSFSQVGFASDQRAILPVRQNATVNRVIRPPGWLGWPFMFLGAVFFLNGVTIRQ